MMDRFQILTSSRKIMPCCAFCTSKFASWGVTKLYCAPFEAWGRGKIEYFPGHHLKKLAHNWLNVLANIALYKRMVVKVYNSSTIEILNVAIMITDRHGEGGAVTDGEGDVKTLGNGLRQQGLPTSGWTKHHDVWLLKLKRECHWHFHFFLSSCCA